jgi:hypothetical protein
MTDKNSGFVESEQVFGVDRDMLYCGDPKKTYTYRQGLLKFTDEEDRWYFTYYQEIFVYSPQLAGWVFFGYGSASEERLSCDEEQNYYVTEPMYAEAISIEAAKARFPEAFPMHEVER